MQLHAWFKKQYHRKLKMHDVITACFCNSYKVYLAMASEQYPQWNNIVYNNSVHSYTVSMEGYDGTYWHIRTHCMYYVCGRHSTVINMIVKLSIIIVDIYNNYRQVYLAVTCHFSCDWIPVSLISFGSIDILVCHWRWSWFVHSQISHV